MSMIYCHDHDRHVDTSYGTCPECIAELTASTEDLQKRIEDLRFDMHVAGCSDGRYHTNGRFNVHKLQLDALERELKDQLTKLDEHF